MGLHLGRRVSVVHLQVGQLCGVITKMDLADAVEFDAAAAHASIQSVRPGMRVFEVSAKTGAGMDEWLEFVQSHAAAI